MNLFVMKNNHSGDWKILTASVVTLLLGLCVGYLIAPKSSQPNTEPQEMTRKCIALIEKGDSLFFEEVLATWRESLVTYKEVKVITDSFLLPLPNLQTRISKLQGKIDKEISKCIRNTNEYLSNNSQMAIDEVGYILEIDPEHQEGKVLLERCYKKWPKACEQKFSSYFK